MAETNAAREAREAKQHDRTIEQVGGEVVEADDSPPSDDTQPPAGTVEVTLAHPLRRPDDLNYLGLDRAYAVGETVRVPRRGAQSLINAGLTQIDPEDKAAVRAALSGR